MHFVFAIICFVLVGCAFDPAENSHRRVASDENGFSIVDAPILSDEGGVVTAELIPHPSHIRKVNASATSQIANVSAEFPPGSFAFQTQTTLQEGYTPVANSRVLSELGYGDDVFINAIGRPVLITWTYDENTVVPYTLTIPDIVDVEVPDDSLVIFYKINLPDTSDFNVGILPPSRLTRGEGVVKFKSRSYGLFQAAYVNKVVTEEKEVKSKEPLKADETPEPGSAPASFDLLLDGLAKRDLHPAKITLMWNPAGGAESFKILLDNDDAGCKTPEKTIENVKILSSVVDTLDGQNYICVFAVNEFGETPASNNGASLLADALVPAAPGGLKGSVDGINVLIEWDSVEIADFAYYELQVGKTKDGKEQFNGPITQSTQHEFAGFESNSDVYYARIRTVDDAGNESPWSKSIGPLKR
jgi:hypothetical protein